MTIEELIQCAPELTSIEFSFMFSIINRLMAEHGASGAALIFRNIAWGIDE